MDWDKLRIFSATVEAGSFTNAGGALHLSQSAISRQVTALEKSLGTTLFHRHARGLRLTEQGELLYDAVREMIARVAIAENLLAENRNYPRGTLRVSTTVDFGAFWLAPRLKEFHEKYPEITIILLLDGGGADLAMLEADVAIQMSAPRKSYLVQRRILTTRSFAYATPEYLNEHGVPRRPSDLDRHRIVVQSGEMRQGAFADDWLLRLGIDGCDARRPIAALSNVHALYRAVASGLGIGALPHFIFPMGLTRVLPEYSSEGADGYFVYPAELRLSKRVMVFKDFVVRKVVEDRLHLDPSDAHRLSDGLQTISHVPIGSLSDGARGIREVATPP